MNGKKRNVGGKPPKPDKASHQVMVRFNDEEYARFLAMYEQSGVYAKAVFIKARVFGAEFRVLKVDKTLVDYYTEERRNQAGAYAESRPIPCRRCEL